MIGRKWRRNKNGRKDKQRNDGWKVKKMVNLKKNYARNKAKIQY